MHALWTALRSGYDRRSLLGLLGLLVLYSAVGMSWSHLIDSQAGVDWLLVGIWGGLSALILWRLDRARDLPLALVALVGGAVIERYGTQAGLWRYFTDERPPLWILPAWPIAALAIDRLCALLAVIWPPRPLSRALYGVAVGGSAVVLASFFWPASWRLSTRLVLVLMVGVAAVGARPARDLRLLIVGSLAGIALEYWGTTRHCWIYYTAQQPPPEAVLAHGFASIAFARGVQGLEALRAWLAPRATLQARRAG